MSEFWRFLRQEPELVVVLALPVGLIITMTVLIVCATVIDVVSIMNRPGVESCE